MDAPVWDWGKGLLKKFHCNSKEQESIEALLKQQSKKTSSGNWPITTLINCPEVSIDDLKCWLKYRGDRRGGGLQPNRSEILFWSSWRCWNLVEHETSHPRRPLLMERPICLIILQVFLLDSCKPNMPISGWGVHMAQTHVLDVTQRMSEVWSF